MVVGAECHINFRTNTTITIWVTTSFCFSQTATDIFCFSLLSNCLTGWGLGAGYRVQGTGCFGWWLTGVCCCIKYQTRNSHWQLSCCCCCCKSFGWLVVWFYLLPWLCVRCLMCQMQFCNQQASVALTIATVVIDNSTTNLAVFFIYFFVCLSLYPFSLSSLLLLYSSCVSSKISNKQRESNKNKNQKKNKKPANHRIYRQSLLYATVSHTFSSNVVVDHNFPVEAPTPSLTLYPMTLCVIYSHNKRNLFHAESRIWKTLCFVHSYPGFFLDILLCFFLFSNVNTSTKLTYNLPT